MPKRSRSGDVNSPAYADKRNRWRPAFCKSRNGPGTRIDPTNSTNESLGDKNITAGPNSAAGAALESGDKLRARCNRQHRSGNKQGRKYSNKI